MYHPFAELARRHELLGLYYRVETDPRDQITWYMNDAFGDWRHELYKPACCCCFRLDEDLSGEVTPVDDAINQVDHQRQRAGTYYDDGVGERSRIRGPAVKTFDRAGGYDYPSVFRNYDADAHMISPLPSTLGAGWAYENPINITSDEWTVEIWYKFEESGMVEDFDDDMEPDALSWGPGTMVCVQNYNYTGLSYSIDTTYKLQVQGEYTRNGAWGCVQLTASLGDASCVLDYDTQEGAHLTNTEWHQLVVTVKAGTIWMYVDGRYQSSGTGIHASFPSTPHFALAVNSDTNVTTGFEGVDRVAYGPVMVYDSILTPHDIYRHWASVRRPLDIAIEPTEHTTDYLWSTKTGWDSSKKCQWRHDGRWAKAYQGATYLQRHNPNAVMKFRSHMQGAEIENQDGNMVEGWEGGYPAEDPVQVAAYFWTWWERHLGFMHMLNGGQSFIWGLEWYPYVGGGSTDPRAGKARMFGNFVGATDGENINHISMCDGLMSELENGDQPDRGMFLQAHQSEGWELKFSYETSSGDPLTDFHQQNSWKLGGHEYDGNQTPTTNVYAAHICSVSAGLGAGKTIQHTGWPTKSAGHAAYSHLETTIPPGSGIRTVPSSIGEESHPKQIGVVYDAGGIQDDHYDDHRHGPIGFLAQAISASNTERISRMMQGQAGMRSRPGLRVPLRHFQLTAPTRSSI